VVGWAAVLVAVALVAGALTAYIKYRAIWDSIKHVNVTQDLNSSPRPPKYTNAVNILVIGSDSRAGTNARFGAGVQGQRSDTVMLLHISPGRGHVIVLSFPRDSVVPILACSAEPGTPGQQAQPGQIEQINSTFAYGGPGCLWKTVEHTTGIHLDHFIELNFTGFEKVIDDVGGVNICLPFAVNDARSKLHLSRGPHHVMGPEALAFWRARYIGQGTDPQRIQRDQYLMASIVQGIKRSNLLHSPTKVYSVVRDVAKAMTTDIQDPATMISIAESLKGLSATSVQFVQVPSGAYAGNVNWVQWTQPRAATLFSAIAHDRKLPSPASRQPTGQSPTLAVLPASQVRVEVLNGSGADGLAGQAATSLTSRGFDVVGTGDAATFGYTSSVIEYAAPADLSAARTLRAKVGNVRLKHDPSLTSGTVELIVGSNFHGLRPPPAGTAKRPAKSVSQLSKTYGGINGNANLCHDGKAFAGPDGGS
jgi:LCP family protein required for cell wall assembly